MQHEAASLLISDPNHRQAFSIGSLWNAYQKNRAIFEAKLFGDYRVNPSQAAKVISLLHVIHQEMMSAGVSEMSNCTLTLSHFLTKLMHATTKHKLMVPFRTEER